jgi:outer membrane protein assembly factor BamB
MSVIGGVIVVVVLSGCVTGSPSRPLSGVGDLPNPASAWPSAQFDARHSSDTPAVGPQTAHLRWVAHVGGNLTPGPVIGVDGAILVASNAGTLSALDPATGQEKWKLDLKEAYGSDLSTSPSVLADGTILWPGPRDTLYAISSSGRRLWSEHFAGQVLSPAVGGRHRVYVADTTGHVVALRVDSSSHSVAWTVNVDGPDYASPSIGEDGTIYTASDRQLVAITDMDTRGSIRWRFTAKRTIEVSSGVSPSGIVVVGTNGDKEYGIRPDGTAAWSIGLGDWTYSSPAVRSSGLAYFADNSGRVRTVDAATGRVLHMLAPAAPGKEHAWTSVVVDSHGNQYWATMSGLIHGYTATGTALFSLPASAAIDGYPALGSDGTLYVGTTEGDLIAVGR